MNDGEPKFYRYILAYDDGWAPCIDGGLVTLATCKPKIRNIARPGDWVAGFIPGSQNRGLVAWVGRIANKYDVGDYEKAYRGRRDAVYRAVPGGFERLRPEYHSGSNEIRKDLSAQVLVFDKKSTWYFGDNPQPLPDQLIALAARGQGHRVKLRLPGDLQALESWLERISPAGIRGRPRAQANVEDCGGCARPRGAPSRPSLKSGAAKSKRCGER